MKVHSVKDGDWSTIETRLRNALDGIEWNGSLEKLAHLSSKEMLSIKGFGSHCLQLLTVKMIEQGIIPQWVVGMEVTLEMKTAIQSMSTRKTIKRGRLFSRCSSYNETTLTDHLLLLATNIEDSLLEGGCVPGVDYTVKDVMGWAVALMPASAPRELTIPTREEIEKERR